MASRAVSGGGMPAYRCCRLRIPASAAQSLSQAVGRPFYMPRLAVSANPRQPAAWVHSSFSPRSSGCWESGANMAPLLRATLPKRSFSLGLRCHQEEKDGAKKSVTPESKQPPPPPPPSKRGIRKVIPISIPSLTPHENIYTIPNILTFSRLIIAPFIGYAIVHDAHAWALGLFVYAGISDLLDGWIARRWKLQTVVGSVVDPMADKILMTVLTVSLATQGSLPVWLAIIILGRDVGLAIAAIYYRWISLPPPKTLMRYWDFSLPSAEVRPTTISKYNTFLQLGLMGATMVNPLVSVGASTTLTVLQYTVAATTIWSGLSYLFSKDAVKILSGNKKN